MYWPTSLAQQPLDRQQSLVNWFYNRRRHEAIYAARKPRARLIDLGPDYVPGRLYFSLQEILELRPPTLPIEPMVDVANPPFLPIWFCWDHGGQRLVQVDELRQQPTGAAPTPLGPWPAGYGDPWRWSWEPGQGPYAPAPYRGQYDSYALGGPHAVWATQCLIYYKQVIPKGAIFFLEGGSEDHTRRRDGSIEAVESWARMTVAHRHTGWWFIDQPHLEEYTQRYETFDLTGFEQFMLQPPEISPTPKPEDAPQRATAPGRRQGRPQRYSRAQTLHDELVTVGQTLPQDSLYRQEDYAEAMGMSVYTLRSHLRRLREKDPTGLLWWERIVSDTKAQPLD